MPDIPLGTVVGPQGPKGDKGDKGDTGTFSPEDLQRITNLESGKVDKVAGKGLSTNDYTNVDKNAVATIENKVDKVTGKGLSTNDYTTAEKNKLSGIEAQANKTVIDSTLSNPGQAADAKTTGDNLSALRNLLRRMEIHCTASGNPATFSDAKAANVKALSVTITPTQSGSGDPSPSNVRPITGVTSVSVTRTGRNLFGGVALGNRIKEEVPSSTLDTSAGTIRFTSSMFADHDLFTSFKSDTRYTAVLYGRNLKSGATHVNLAFSYTDGTESYLLFPDSADENMQVIFTTPAGKSVRKLYGVWGEGETVLQYDKCGVFEGVITDEDFVPYQGQTVTVPLVDSSSDPLTVYGGTLDVTTGTLSVTHRYFKYAVSSMNNDYDNFPGFPPDANVRLCIPPGYDDAVEGAVVNIGPIIRGNYAQSRLFFTKQDYGMTQTEWKENYPDLEVEAVLPLVSPVTYQLTPQQLTTLPGYNAVFSDAGAVDVTYKADASIVFGGG